MTSPNTNSNDKKIAAGITGILLGQLGIHKFILGYSTEGAIMLVTSVIGYGFSCFLLPLSAPLVMWIIGITEGIIYLTKSDAEFIETYINNKRGWF